VKVIKIFYIFSGLKRLKKENYRSTKHPLQSQVVLCRCKVRR